MARANWRLSAAAAVPEKSDLRLGWPSNCVCGQIAIGGAIPSRESGTPRGFPNAKPAESSRALRREVADLDKNPFRGGVFQPIEVRAG